MLLAIDYDKTITAAPELMKAVIRCFQTNGHHVVCVTMRDKELDWHKDFEELKTKYDVDTIFCDGNAKRKVCADLGVYPDWWLDDWPEGIGEDSKYTPIELTRWRESQKEVV